VIASLTSAWIAVRSDDGLVAQDYYKQGLLINERLKRSAADPERHLGARIDVTADGAVRAHIDGLATLPPSLRLTLTHPQAGGHPEIITLARDGEGDYRGALAHATPGRWVLTLEADGWRLPTTTGVGRLTEVRLGTAERT